jgi:hypothetical protein
VLPRPAGTPERLRGIWALLAFALLAFFTTASLSWSLTPGDSWLEANRAFAYLGTFAAGFALARLAPRRWSALLGGVLLGSMTVVGWALLTKVLPAALAPDEPYARLRPPFDYWNSVGLAAALMIVPLLWLAVRRTGHAAVNALAWPGLGLSIVCMLLSYSRGALLAAAIGIALWLAIVPRRLAGVVVLGSVIAVTIPVVAWAFAQDGLTLDSPPLSLRVDAGLELGALLLLLCITLLIAGLAAGFLAAHHPPGERVQARASRILVGALVVVPAIAILALANAPGGLNGQVSKAWKQATDPTAHTPGNTPSRLTATSSVRSRYWREALDVHAASPWLGGGAGAYATLRLRYRTDQLSVKHAHGYVVQTLADLGWAGLAVSLLAMFAWLWAAAQDDRPAPARPRPAMGRGANGDGRRDRRRGRVRRALRRRLDVVRARQRGAPSAVRGLGGRARALARATGGRDAPGARARTPGRPGRRRRPGLRDGPHRRLVGAPAGALRARGGCRVRAPGPGRADAGDLDREDRPQARSARARSPCSTSRSSSRPPGNNTAAGDALEKAVQLEPANPEPWRRLGEFRLNVTNDPRGALEAYQAAYYLDPALAAERLRRARRVASDQRLARATSIVRAGAVDLDARKARVLQRGLQRAASEEADVLAERVEVALEARQRDGGGLEPAVIRDGDEHASVRFQHAPHLQQRVRDVRDVLEHLRAPHQIDLAMADGKAAVGLQEPDVGAGHVVACPVDGLLGDLNADRVGEAGEEAPGAAAEVEDSVPRLDLALQQRVSLRERPRLGVLRRVGPERFVELAQRLRA